MLVADLLLAIIALRAVAESSGIPVTAWVAESAPSAPPYLRAVARLGLHPRLEVGAQLFLLHDLLFHSVQVSVRLSPSSAPEGGLGVAAPTSEPGPPHDPGPDGGSGSDFLTSTQDETSAPQPAPEPLGGYGISVGTGHEFEVGSDGRIRDQDGAPFIALSAWARQVTGHEVQTSQMLSFLHYLVPGRQDVFFFFTDVRYVYPDRTFFGAEFQATRSPTGRQHANNTALAFGYLY